MSWRGSPSLIWVYCIKPRYLRFWINTGSSWFTTITEPKIFVPQARHLLSEFCPILRRFLTFSGRIIKDYSIICANGFSWLPLYCFTTDSMWFYDAFPHAFFPPTSNTILGQMIILNIMECLTIGPSLWCNWAGMTFSIQSTFILFSALLSIKERLRLWPRFPRFWSEILFVKVL